MLGSAGGVAGVGGDGPISRRRPETLLRSKAEWGRSTRPSWAICSHFLLQEATPAPNRLTEQVRSRDPGSSQRGCSGGQIGFHGHEAGCVCGRSDASLANRLDGSSTGGFLVAIVHPMAVLNGFGKLNAFAWRSFKLPRVARSSLSAEAQVLSHC